MKHLCVAAFCIAAWSLTLTSPQSVSSAELETSDGAIRVDNWGYQLQGPGSENGELLPEPLAAAQHDLIVMDFARFGDDNSMFTPADVSAIANSSTMWGGDGSRKVTAGYVSIGEASEFRSSWDPDWTADGTANSPLAPGAPSWLGPVNPDWPQSRKVRYWDANWQSVIYNSGHTGWLDQVVTQGFDAAYLDIVDGYYFWGSEVAPSDQQPGDPIDEQDAARRMAEFVVGMTSHARTTNPDFFVIPQNGAFILNDLEFGGSNSEPGDAALAAAYLEAVGAIGVEDVYFSGDLDTNNAFHPDADRIEVLQGDFLAAGVPVFVVEYIDESAKVTQFYDAVRTDGFIPYAAPSRELDLLGPPAPSLISADFDADGDVDGDDFLAWQSGFGTSAGATPAEGDADADGDVDGDDFLLWQSQFGTGGGSDGPPALVPEAGAIWLSLVAAGLALTARKRLARC